MPKYEVGQQLQKRCTSCYHNELQIIKVVPREFKEKIAYVLWTQCPECGTNDNNLTPEGT